MKIEPSFPDHWKTKRLHRACGADAVLGLIRLWGQAKIKRQYNGLELTPLKLAAVMEYPGDEKRLWEAMTDPQAPWLDQEEGGTWALHGFAEHQRQIIAMWKNGRSGGRPVKSGPLSPTPPIPNTSSSTSSSSSPIRFQNETIRLQNETIRFPQVFTTPKLEEWVASCNLAGIEQALAEEIWHDNEGRGISPEGYWIDYQGNAIRNPIANAKARAAAMKQKRSRNNGKTSGGVRDRKELLYDGTGDW